VLHDNSPKIPKAKLFKNSKILWTPRIQKLLTMDKISKQAEPINFLFIV
jgi:hypothetical protein